MLIKVKELSAESIDLREVKDFEWLAASLAGASARPAPAAKVDVSARVHSISGNVFVQAAMKTALLLQCARCATEWMQPTEYAFSLTLSPAMAETPEEAEEVELTKDDVDFTYYSGDSIDLDTSLREELILQTPEFPLCKPECNGLCPSCGIDLNKSTCRCAPPVAATAIAESPFAVLRTLQLKK